MKYPHKYKSGNTDSLVAHGDSQQTRLKKILLESNPLTHNTALYTRRQCKNHGCTWIAISHRLDILKKKMITCCLKVTNFKNCDVLKWNVEVLLHVFFQD